MRACKSAHEVMAVQNLQSGLCSAYGHVIMPFCAMQVAERHGQLLDFP